MSHMCTQHHLSQHPHVFLNSDEDYSGTVHGKGNASQKLAIMFWSGLESDPCTTELPLHIKAMSVRIMDVPETTITLLTKNWQ